jgi:TusA-related sulfurtransferase
MVSMVHLARTIPDLTVDARDELCPRPLFMAKNALRKADGGELIEVLSRLV